MNLESYYMEDQIHEDPILFPKELEMNLSPYELLKLEEHLISQGQLNEDEDLYYDSEKNIRKRNIHTEMDILSDLEDMISIKI